METIANLYLIPSGVILAALGVSTTEPLKTAVSLVGLVLALFWGYSTLDVFPLASPTNFECTLAIMPWLAAFLWAVSLLVHIYRWCKFRSACRQDHAPCSGRPPSASASDRCGIAS